MQKPELGRRELQAPALDVDPVLHRVDRKRAPDDLPFRVALPYAAAAKHGADARDQLPGTERLVDVVVRADAETQDDVALLTASRDHDHGQVARRVDGAKAAADIQAVQAGQQQVQQHDVRLLAADHGQPAPTAGRGRDLEALAPEVVLDQFENVRLVLDDDDLGGAHA